MYNATESCNRAGQCDVTVLHDALATSELVQCDVTVLRDALATSEHVLHKKASSSSVALPLTSIGKCSVFRFSCRKSIFAFSLAASEVFTSMMVQCFVPDCNYQSERDACGVYRFPKDPEEKKKWIKLIA